MPASTRRTACLAAALFALGVTGAGAQTYPSKPIRIIVNTAPGGALDATARIVAQHLTDELKQTVIVENKPGGGGLLGIRNAKAAPADGYTLLAVSSALTILPSIRKEPGYDPLKDFIPVGSMVRMPFVLVAPAAVPYKSVQDVLADAKATPGKVNYASAGLGSTTYLAAAKLFKDADRQATHVPYNGNGAAMADLLGGRVDLLFEQVGVAMPHVKSGRLRMLGVTTASRLDAAPDVPTIAEQGVSGYNYVVWNGLFAPAGTPKEAVHKLDEALRRVLAKKEVSDRIRSGGDEPLPMSSPDFQHFVATELAKSEKLVSDLKLPKD
jgi:tripartite-type tricarboxylate transporter receptor subunit TctC